MKKSLETIVTTSLDTLDTKVKTTTSQFDRLVDPARSTFAKRYPTIFSLLVTLGVIMTFLGVEQLLLSSAILERYPALILGLGIGLLALTGTLYKKLL